MKRLSAAIKWFFNLKPVKPLPVSYETVAIRFIKNVGPEAELYFDCAIKAHEGCYIWGMTVDPTGMIWLMDADMTWGKLELKDKMAPRLLSEIYPVLMSREPKYFKPAV